MSQVTELQDKLREANNELAQWRVFGTPVELVGNLISLKSDADYLGAIIKEALIKTKEQDKLRDELYITVADLSHKNNELHDENQKLNLALQKAAEDYLSNSDSLMPYLGTREEEIAKIVQSWTNAV